MGVGVDHQEIDAGLGGEARRDARRERDGGLFGPLGRVVAVDEDRQADLHAVLGGVRPNVRHTRARPGARVQVLERVPGPVGPHAVDLALARRSRARVVAQVRGASMTKLDRADLRDAWDDEEAHPLAVATRPYREPQRNQRPGVEAVQVVLPAGHERRLRDDRRLAPGLDRRDAAA